MKIKEGFNAYTNSYFPHEPLTNEQLDTAEANGIQRCMARQRRHALGWSVEDCITKPAKKYTGERRKILEKYRPILKQIGLSEARFSRRVFIDKHDPEEVIRNKELWKDKPTSKVRKKIFTPEQIAIAASNGIDYKRLSDRMSKRGRYTIERAITEPVGATRPGRPGIRGKEL